MHIQVKYELQPLTRLLPEHLHPAYLSAAAFYSKAFGISKEDLEASTGSSAAIKDIVSLKAVPSQNVALPAAHRGAHTDTSAAAAGVSYLPKGRNARALSRGMCKNSFGGTRGHACSPT